METKIYQPTPIPTKDGLMNIYLPKYQKAALRGYYPDRGNCRGCGKEFKHRKRTWEPAYFQHCGNECEEFKKLGLILFSHEICVFYIFVLNRTHHCL